jgi:hypothetical protein
LNTGFRLPLPLMRAIRLQNRTTFSLNFDYNTRITENTSSSSNTYEPQEKSTSWTLQPQMVYSFSDTVDGKAFFMMQQTKDDITHQKTRLFELGVQVKIAIRG